MASVSRAAAPVSPLPFVDSTWWLRFRVVILRTVDSRPRESITEAVSFACFEAGLDIRVLGPFVVIAAGASCLIILFDAGEGSSFLSHVSC